MPTARCLPRRLALHLRSSKRASPRLLFSKAHTWNPRLGHWNPNQKLNFTGSCGSRRSFASAASRGDAKNGKPSLIEQLFPEESKRYEEEQRALREVPRLTLDHQPVPRSSRPKNWMRNDKAAKRFREENDFPDSGTSVLVLRNASPNLTEEDFRRLIPQGQHLEGWTLEQGDIIKVIAGRDLATLAHQNVYYLLFSSPMHAFTYQGHATRIGKLAYLHTPSSASSPIPPPPGYVMEGLDVHSALEAYALAPPSQRLDLRQLKPPLSPHMQTLVRRQGYPDLVDRKDRMPFEARLTMEGPQLSANALRHIFLESAKSRALSWSGGYNMNLSITRWESKFMPSAHDGSVIAAKRLQSQVDNERAVQAETEMLESEEAAKLVSHKMRPAQAVYIVGFHTEKAAQSFVQHWHRRALKDANGKAAEGSEGDLPAIANVELLW